MGSQNGPVSRYVVSHKLAEDRPSGRSVRQRGGSVIDVSAIAETAGAAERIQELLICIERRKFGKHTAIVRGPERRIDGYCGACRRQATNWDGCGWLSHEYLNSLVRCRFRAPLSGVLPFHCGSIAWVP